MRSLVEGVQSRGGESGSEQKMGEFVPKEVWDKWKVEGRCMKCGSSNRLAWDCKPQLEAKTSRFSCSANWEPVQQRRRFDKGQLKIMDLSLEEDSGNE